MFDPRDTTGLVGRCLLLLVRKPRTIRKHSEYGVWLRFVARWHGVRTDEKGG